MKTGNKEKNKERRIVPDESKGKEKKNKALRRMKKKKIALHGS